VERVNLLRGARADRRDEGPVSAKADRTPSWADVRSGDAGVYEVRDHLWSRTTYEACLCEAGRGTIWHPLTPDPEGRCRLGDDFWDEILGNPPIAVFTARA